LEEAVGNRTVHPIPPLLPMRTSSPDVVRVLDQIRFQFEALDQQRGSVDYAECTCFAREYPRCSRYHLDCSQYRLCGINSLCFEIHEELAPTVAENPTLVSIAIENLRGYHLYWDFESFLSEITTALDLIAREAGNAYPQPMPPI